jgi:hypothetical protein
VHPQEKRRAHLLGGRTEVDRLPVDGHAIAAALVHAVIGPDRVRMLAAKPGEAEVLADLLVRASCEEHVAGGLEALPRQRRDCDRARRHLTLHIESSPSPDVVVAKVPGPGIDRPLARIGQDGIRVG